jgi:hypothetical protein
MSAFGGSDRLPTQPLAKRNPVQRFLAPLRRGLHTAQKLHSGFFEVSAFKGCFEAWVRGPVDRKVYTWGASSPDSVAARV